MGRGKDHHFVLSVSLVKINAILVRHLDVEEQQVDRKFSQEPGCFGRIGKGFFQLQIRYLRAKRFHDLERQWLIIYGNATDHFNSNAKLTEKYDALSLMLNKCLPLYNNARRFLTF